MLGIWLFFPIRLRVFVVYVFDSAHEGFSIYPPPRRGDKKENKKGREETKLIGPAVLYIAYSVKWEVTRGQQLRLVGGGRGSHITETAIIKPPHMASSLTSRSLT